MSRMWVGVDPEELCQQHLLGEHSEIHQEFGQLRVGNVACVRGHLREGQFYPGLAHERHGALADELERRGMNHDSPLGVPSAKETVPELFEPVPSEMERERTRDRLAARCDDCMARMQEVPLP